jgi:transmembrane sensor
MAVSGAPFEAAVTGEDGAIGWALRHQHGDMTFPEIEAFAAWLGMDGRNGAAFDEAMAAWDMVDGLPLDPSLVALRCEALDALRKVQADTPPAARMGLRGFAIAASLVLAAICGIGGYLWNAPETYRTGAGERRVLVLADGSRVTLDGRTSLRVAYSDHARQLTLEQGRATFAVAKDPLRPFSVASQDSMVVATGTRFSVERLGSQTRVLLYQGHVAILRERGGRFVPGTLAGPHGSELAEAGLVPGRELVVPSGELPLQLKDVPDPAAASAWEQGRIEAAAEPLGLVAARMNRYFSGSGLSIARNAAAIPVSGVFEAGDIEAFVDGITSVSPVVAERMPDGSFHLRRRSSSISSRN